MIDFYHDIEPYCCKVLRERINDGDLPNGTVVEGDVRELEPKDLEGYRQIHLFAEIGGFALGLANAGFEGQILTAGFPCQDISLAGKGAGLAGKRSGLWWETLAAVSVVRPPVVLLENVAALLRRGVDAVLGSLASIGYDAQWHCIPASYVGACHRRDRIWIVANPLGRRCGTKGQYGGVEAMEGGRPDHAVPTEKSGSDVGHPIGTRAGDKGKPNSGCTTNTRGGWCRTG